MAQTKIEQGLLKFTEATDYLKIPTGTTAQRPSSPAAGYLRFNTTVGKTEVYDGTSWSQIGVVNPTISSLDYPGNKTALDPAGGETLLINGADFVSGVTVTFGGTNATSITLNSSAQLSVVVPAKAAGDHDLTVSNTDGGTVTTTVTYNALPTWTTAAGSLGSVQEGASMSFTVAASESDGGAITYAITSGALPSGGSLNTSTGAITGTASSVSADTTSNFTITATDNENQTASRAFSITVTNVLPSENFGTVIYTGDGEASREVNGGKYGGAAYFNGSNGEIALPTALSDGSSVDANCISFWFNVDAEVTSSTANNEIMSFAYSGGSNGKIALGSTTGNFANETFSVSSDVTSQYTYSTTNIPAGWNHAVVQWNSSNTKWDIYINGTAHTTYTFGTNEQGKLALKFGKRSSFYYNGKLDQVRIFTRVLSSSEITTLYTETDPESLNPLSETETSVKGATRFYQFNNNTTDTAGNYDGSATGVTYTTDSKYGSHAIDFAGNNNSYVDLDACGINGDRSYSMWVNFDEFDQNMFLVDSADRQSANHFGGSGVAMYNSSDDTLKLQWNTYDGSAYGSGKVARTFQANEWVHLIFATKANNHKIYINGVEQPFIETDRYSTRKADPGNLRLGDESRGSQSGGFDGQMDQVRIFNRWISPPEAMALYNETSLAAFYKFDGNSEDATLVSNGTDTNMDYEFGLNFTPDFVWVKNRSEAFSLRIVDSTRGATKHLSSDTTAAEGTSSNNVLSFDTGGFSVGSSQTTNKDGNDLVAWCLKANGGTTSSNTDGDITSTVQANSAAGFAIAKVTGSGSQQTFGHGLGSTPELIIRKNLSTTENWTVYTTVIDGSLDYMRLNLTDAAGDSGFTAPTSTVFTNPGNTNNFIYYSFVSVSEFSKISKYTGNGSTEGPIVETGFEPGFLLIKRTSNTADWVILDNKRTPNNPRNKYLIANSNAAETTSDRANFYSNGFQIITTGANVNFNGDTYIYMAFAGDPDTVVPTKAKSFNVATYTGNGSTQSITGIGFQPSLIWIKSRSNTYGHRLIDSITGPDNYLTSDSTAIQQGSGGAGLNSFDNNGFSLGSGNAHNANTATFVAWAWKMNDDEPEIMTDGSINSIVSANANAGMSIVSYTGTGSAATIAHGLNSAPEMIIVKNRSNADNWRVYHTELGATKYLNLNDTNAAATASTIWNDTAPTSTVFSIGTAGSVSTDGDEYIAYCFHSVTGYSKFGSYTGTGNAGNSINIGFQADFVIIRRTDNAQNWLLFDSVRGSDDQLFANTSGVENDVPGKISFTSTGFSLENSHAESNASGGTYIYAAFKIN